MAVVCWEGNCCPAGSKPKSFSLAGRCAWREAGRRCEKEETKEGTDGKQEKGMKRRRSAIG